MRFTKMATVFAIGAMLIFVPATAATSKKKAVTTTTRKAAKAIVPAPIVLQGTGEIVSDAVTLAKGTITTAMTHDGSSNFQVELVDPNTGKAVAFLANEIGPWTGTNVDELSASGKYLVQVAADGAWTIRIEHPRPTTGLSLPQKFSGHGEAIAGVLAYTGGAKFTMSHNGTSNFQVDGFDPASGRDLFLANEIGQWSGSKVAPLKGIRIIHVKADGDWTITVSKA